MKRILLIVFLLFFNLAVKAQQLGMFSHYFFKPLIYNPAYTGSDNSVNAMLIKRIQWTGFKGAPDLTVFTLDGNLINEKTGIGLSIISDKKGISNKTGGNILYAHKVNLNNDLYLSFGASFGVFRQTLDYSKVIVENSNDPNIFNDLQNKTSIDASAGLVLGWNDLLLGMAIPQMLGNRVNYDNGQSSVSYKQMQHYLATVKYKFYLDQIRSISLSPQGLIRYVPQTPFQYEGNVNLDWNQKFWIGTTYKSDYAVAANVGFCAYRQLFVGYSYDFILGNIGQYSGMSHEIMLNYRFGQNKKSEARYHSENKGPDIDVIQNPAPKNELIHELNVLISKQLLKDIEAVLDKKHVSQNEIQDLNNRIQTFLESGVDTQTNNTLKKYYELLNPTEKELFVIVKGILTPEKEGIPINYPITKITVRNKETNELIGIYTPNSQSGKYLLILSPGKKYLITVENKEFQTYEKEITIAPSKESYEMENQIKLKK